MPELPEVETIVRDLRGELVGASIENVRVLREKLIRGVSATVFARRLAGRRILDVSRRGKLIVMGLSAERWGLKARARAPDEEKDWEEHLVVGLGMTGRLLVMKKTEDLPTHVGVVFDLNGGSDKKLVYQDVRRFGRIRLLSDPEWKRESALMGVEPLGWEFGPDWLCRNLKGSPTPIKVWLMDGRKVVGVGNIYASEALFRARIHPARATGDLASEECARLHRAIRGVLEESIAMRGTTFRDYRDAKGEKGSFASRLQVYGRAGESCHNCGTPVSRITQGGRSTFFCPSCQK